MRATVILALVLTFARASRDVGCLVRSDESGRRINGCVKKSQGGQTSEKHTVSIQRLIGILQWNHTIVFSDHHYSNGELQLLCSRLGLTTVYDLGDLHSGIEVKDLLQQLHKKFFPRLNFLILSNYSRALQLLQIVDRYDMESNRTTEFRHHSFWMVGCYSPCHPEISVLPHIHHLENVVLLYPSKCGRSGLLRLITPGGKAFSPVKDSTGIMAGDIFPNRRYDLNRRTLAVSTIVYEPFVMKRGNYFEGYLIDVLDAIASSLNFSYRIAELADGGWDGLVAQLARREVDLVVTALTIHEDREKVMDFLYPPIATWTDDIVYNLETDGMGRWQVFLKPFSSIIFLILSVTLVVSTLMGYVLLRCDDVHRGRTRNIYERVAGKSTVSDTFFYMFGILINKGEELYPENHSTRLLLFTWGLFSVVIATCYSANLVAIFAVQKPNLPFTSLGELVRKKEYKWGFQSGTIRDHIFNQSRSPDMMLAWEGILKFNKTDPDVLSPDEDVHIAKLKKEKYALITYRYAIENIRRNDCNIHQVGQSIILQQLGIGVPTDYPLKKDLERVLGAIADSGFSDIWRRRWINRKSTPCVKDRSIVPLTLTDVVSVFCLFSVGLGAACIVLVIELIIYTLLFKRNIPRSRPRCISNPWL